MTLRVQVITLFPEAFAGYLDVSILGRARRQGLLEVSFINPRDFTTDVHRTVDDAPYGGGAGMVMKVEPVSAAIERARSLQGESRVVLLTPRGTPFEQKTARRYADHGALTLVCGRYEGVDERIARVCVDESLSLGDFVLTGGELAALAVIDASSRMIPGVLGNPEGTAEESFTDRPLLEHPQYTRPRSWRGHDVPDVLLSGNHAEIARWRDQQRLHATEQYRPELLQPANHGDNLNT
jgi:tRNA (guanine37-N1)-methyltransferase